jgi:hypothetical protein
VRAKTLTDLSNTPAQRQAMRLAYLHAVGSLWRGGRAAAANHAYRAAFRQVLKSADVYQAYLRANLRALARRTLRTLRSTWFPTDQIWASQCEWHSSPIVKNSHGISDVPLGSEADQIPD